MRNGAVARYKVGGDTPKSHKELIDPKLLTRPREILVFEDMQLLGQALHTAHCALLAEREGPSGAAIADTEPRDSVGMGSD
jgi:hypothetical protein